MSRPRPLPWLPTTISFSSITLSSATSDDEDYRYDPTESLEFGKEDDHPDGYIESLILDLLHQCEDDGHRVLFLVLVLKQAGYNIEHSDVAKALDINERVYYRKLKAMRELLKKRNPRLI